MKPFHDLLRILPLLLLLTAATNSYARKNAVWIHPDASSSVSGYSQVVEKVEFRPDETIVVLQMHSRNKFTYAPETALHADGKTYALKSAEGIEPGQFISPSDDVATITFHFEPLPAGTEKFDLKEPGAPKRGFAVNDIRPRDNRIINGTYWRDDTTGDWAIGFFPEGVVYDGRFWTYTGNFPDKDATEGTFSFTDGTRTITAKVGKEKSLRRTIKIGDRKQKTFSRIIQPRLPDYPQKDLRPSVADNGYAPGDSVEISGWMRGNADHATPIEVQIDDIFAGDENRIPVSTDAAGHFHVKFPVCNTQTVDLRFEPRDLISVPVEPNRKYFLLNDFDSGKKIFMGEDVRLQNELLAYQLNRWPVSAHRYEKNPAEFFPALKDFEAGCLKELDSLAAAHPTLSERYKAFKRDDLKSKCAFSLGQAYFYISPYPEEMMEYVKSNHIADMPHPLTAYPMYSTFIDNISSAKKQTEPRNFMIPIKINDRMAHMSILLSEGGAAESQPLAARLQQLRKENDYTPHLTEEEQSVQAEIMRIDSVAKSRLSDTELELEPIMFEYQVLDKLGFNQEAKDIYMSEYLLKKLNQSGQPLKASEENAIGDIIRTPAALNEVMALNDKFIRLQSGELPLRNRQVALSPELTAGKDLLDKILEPMKGKTVLIDVWGTWCAPCRNALKDFRKEEEYLRKYDIAYLFLANRSPETSWKKIISDLAIDGDNVYHYNLPEAQQTAIEQYLGVRSFPSYFLVNADGEVVDIKVDARNIAGLERAIKSLK